MKIAFEGQEIGNMKQLEAGKGVVIEEGKINVALPVEVLSADEYAALPEVVRGPGTAVDPHTRNLVNPGL